METEVPWRQRCCGDGGAMDTDTIHLFKCQATVICLTSHLSNLLCFLINAKHPSVWIIRASTVVCACINDTYQATFPFSLMACPGL